MKTIRELEPQSEMNPHDSLKLSSMIYSRSIGSMAGLMLLLVSSLACAQPVINRVSPTGLHLNQPTKITFQGNGLNEVSNVLLKGNYEAEILEKSDTTLVAQISLGADQFSGVHAIRLVSSAGASNPTWVCFDQCVETPAEVPFDGSNQSKTSVINGASKLRFPLELQSPTSLVIEVVSNRLGQNWKPVLRLLKNDGTQIAWSNPEPSFGGDAMIRANLEKGSYTIEMHDLLLRAKGQQQFRLRVGNMLVADYAWPAFGNAGTDIRGNVISNSNSELNKHPWMTQPTAATFGWQPVKLGRDQAWAGLTPRYLSHTIQLENETDEADASGVDLDPAKLRVFPGVINSDAPNGVHSCKVSPGRKYRFEVFAQRIGSPLDSVLVVRRPGAAQLGRGDDQVGTSDSMVEVAIPQDVQQVELVVSDLLRNSGEHHVYQIVATDITKGEFAPTLTSDSVSVPENGFGLLVVDLNRKGYQGGLIAKLPELNPSVLTFGEEIGPQSTRALIAVRSSDAPFPPQLTSVLFQPAENDALSQVARVSENRVTRFSPWLGTTVAIINSSPSPLQFEISIPENVPVWAGGTVDAKVRFEKRSDEGLASQIKLQLVTSQVAPKKTVKVNNQDQQVDDADRTIRMANEVVWNESTSEAVAKLIIPADLPENTWQVAWRLESGETAQTKTINASRVFTLNVKQALSVTLEKTEKPREVSPASSIKVKGNLQRHHEFTGPVEISLNGLPEGFSSTTAIVESDASEFAIQINAPEGAMPVKLGNLILSSIAYPTHEDGQLNKDVPPTAQSVPVAFELNVVAATAAKH